MKTQQEKGIANRQKFRVYLLDYQPVFLQGFALLIGQETDLQVCGCTTLPRQALADLPRLRPDLLIADLGLGGPIGIAFLKTLTVDCKCRVMVLSMQEEAVYAERVLRAGALGYIMKVAPVPEVLKAIRKALRGERYLSETMQEKMLAKLGQKQPPTPAAPLEQLSDRDLEIFHLLGKGISTRQIANQLYISIKTVETHRAHLKEKLGVKTGLELFRLAVEWMSQPPGHQPSQSDSHFGSMG